MKLRSWIFERSQIQLCFQSSCVSNSAVFPIQCFFLIESVVRILETGRRKYLRLYHKPFTDKAENATHEFMVAEFGSLLGLLSRAYSLSWDKTSRFMHICQSVKKKHFFYQNLDGGRLYFVYSWTRGCCLFSVSGSAWHINFDKYYLCH